VRFKIDIGKLNKVEKTYIILFVFSILAGILYGVINKNYFKSYESALEFAEGETSMTIFAKNFILSAINLITAGVTSFYFNFTTFSIASSYLYSSGMIFALPLLFIHGSFEMLGSMFFGLVGLNLLEKKIIKLRSRLKTEEVFWFGVILLFVGAVIEYLLWLLMK